MTGDSKKPKGYKVVIPQLGLTMQEANITEWLHADGDWVQKGEPLFLLENEKSVVEVESPATGHLRIHVETGVTVPVLHSVAIIESVDSVPDHHSAQLEQKQVVLTEEETKVDISRELVSMDKKGQVIASPRARKAAREKGLELRQIQGSGIRGMIVMSDLERHTANRGTRVLVSPIAQKLAEAVSVNLSDLEGSGPRGMIMRNDVEAKIRLQLTSKRPEPIQGLTGLRAIIAERLSQSWQQSPHVTLTMEVDACNLVSFRKLVNERHSGESNEAKISFTTLLIKLTSQVIKKYPYMNSRLTSRGIEQLPDVNIGFAVDTDRGLMVPVIRSADQKTLSAIQSELDQLAERARKGRSLPDDLSEGTFSVTNLGGFEIDAFTPIINPPECAVLGVGRIHPRPVGVEGQIVLREMMIFSLTFDHRLVDGAPAARFLQDLKHVIENSLSLKLN